MAVKLDTATILEALFPESSPLVKVGDRNYMRYDQIKVSLGVSSTLVEFIYQGQSLWHLDLEASQPGDTIELTNLQGLSEVTGFGPPK